MKRLQKLLISSLLAWPLFGHALSGDAIDGQVIDDSTGKPIADAIVVARWEGSWSKIAESSTSCYHVETARTDANGKYHMAEWTRGWKPDDLRVSNRQIYFSAYKPEYTFAPRLSSKKGTVLLIPFKGTKDEYFDYLDRLAGSNGCPGGGESKKNLYRLYAPLAEEARSTAENLRQKKLAEKFVGATNRVLVDYSKPTTTDRAGWTVNVNPDDNYKTEDILK